MDEIANVLQNISFQDGGWVLMIPACLMAIDILTGVTHAWITGHLKSYRMREGLGKKVGEVMILLIGQIFTIGLSAPTYFVSGASVYIIFMEMVSICENLKKLGVPIPRFVDKALESMNEQIQNGSIRKVGDTDGKTKEDQ